MKPRTSVACALSRCEPGAVAGVFQAKLKEALLKGAHSAPPSIRSCILLIGAGPAAVAATLAVPPMVAPLLGAVRATVGGVESGCVWRRTVTLSPAMAISVSVMSLAMFDWAR